MDTFTPDRFTGLADAKAPVCHLQNSHLREIANKTPILIAKETIAAADNRSVYIS